MTERDPNRRQLVRNRETGALSSLGHQPRAPVEQESWRSDLRCVLNDFGECLAKVPEACLCKQMPKREFEEARYRILGEKETDKEALKQMAREGGSYT